MNPRFKLGKSRDQSSAASKNRLQPMSPDNEVPSDAASAAYDPVKAFDQLARSGFLPDLMAGIPPNAKQSKRSKINPKEFQANAGKLPGKYYLDEGAWSGVPNWNDKVTTKEDLEEFKMYPGASVLIRTKRCGCFDIDVTDANLATDIEQLVVQELGRAPRRIGRAPKRLLLYRSRAPPRTSIPSKT